MSSESSRDASPSALARRPSSASRSGGFQIATRVPRAATCRDRRRSPALPSAPARARPRSRSSPTQAGTAARPRRSAPAAGGGAARSRRGSRRRRGRRAPRRRRRSARLREDVSPAVVVREDADVEHVRVREDEVRPLADLPAPLAAGCRRRRSPAGGPSAGARRELAPDPARAPSWGRGRGPASSARARSRRAREG